MWIVPVMITFILIFLVLAQIDSMNEPTFKERVELYFHNDWSTVAYGYGLIVLISVIITGFFYLYVYLKRF